MKTNKEFYNAVDYIRSHKLCEMDFKGNPKIFEAAEYYTELLVAGYSKKDASQYIRDNF